MEEFLEKNESKHEFIRKNILTATLNFNNRVQEFIKHIIMNTEGEMCVEYYNYRVEFQMRGAGHIHGTLWIDWNELKKKMGAETVDLVVKGFRNIKDERFGSEEHRNEFDGQKNEDSRSAFYEEHDALAEFIDKFCTCSLKDPRTRDIVKSVNIHNHTKTCKKYLVECRFWFPRFPSLRTIIAVPAEVIYKDPDVATKKLQEANAMLKLVKDVLEDDDEMAALCNYGKAEIDCFVSHKNIVLKIKDIVEEESTGIALDWENLDHTLKHAYSSFFINVTNYKKHISLDNLDILSKLYIKKSEDLKIENIEEKRLILLLGKAKIEGEKSSDKLRNYEKALSIAPKRYSVVVKRDIDEIYVNLYNPEWIICWDGNIDIQPCLDYFGVITYITDYYMKDDSGTLKFIKEVLDKDPGATIKTKLNLVKNTFLTHRQIGESEAYYKLFQHLHLSHSNISAVFAPTGFKRNRSRFLKQITEEEASYCENVIEVEDKEGKYYVEKVTMIEKLLKKPILVKPLVYSQFVKRYENTKTVPTSYNFKKDMELKLTQKDIDNGDYIFTDKDPVEKEIGRKLPSKIHST